VIHRVNSIAKWKMVQLCPKSDIDTVDACVCVFFPVRLKIKVRIGSFNHRLSNMPNIRYIFGTLCLFTMISYKLIIRATSQISAKQRQINFESAKGKVARMLKSEIRRVLSVTERFRSEWKRHIDIGITDANKRTYERACHKASKVVKSLAVRLAILELIPFFQPWRHWNALHVHMSLSGFEFRFDLNRNDNWWKLKSTAISITCIAICNRYVSSQRNSISVPIDFFVRNGMQDCSRE